jgi:hypothetical protein
MWQKIRAFHKDQDAGMLEGSRNMNGLMGLLFVCFTGWHFYDGGSWTAGVALMAALALLGMIGFVIYTALVNERTSAKR